MRDSVARIRVVTLFFSRVSPSLVVTGALLRRSTAMAKKRIDCIAKYSQRHRGPPPKRRTDFSIFACSSPAFPSSSKSSPDSFPGLSSHSIDGLSGPTRNNLDSETCKGSSGCTFTPCCKRQDCRCDVPDIPMTEVAPIAQIENCSHRNLKVGNQENGVIQDAGKCPDQYKTPVSIMESKANASAVCEPAEALNGGTSQIQLFNNPDSQHFSDQPLASSDKGISSNSSEADDESSKRGRGKRKRKPKLYFHEDSSFKLKSSKKVRRFKIMRHLGLMAPLGSPF